MQPHQMIAGRYRKLRLLGRGGFAEVFLAEDTRLGNRRVALKLLAQHILHDQERIQKFRQEAEIIGHLTSQNTVRAYDFGSDSFNNYYIAMEYVQGETLHEVLRREKNMDIERVLRIGIQLLDALEEAHNLSIIHRDLKPKNIMLLPQRHGEWVKVLDFGVARIIKKEDDVDGDWTLVGTATYMAPEQAQGRPVSPASDLYSVGVILYHCITGRPPFTSKEDPVAIMIHHATKPVQSMRKCRPDLEILPQIDQAILRSLEKDPKRRFTSSQEFRLVLEDALHAFLEDEKETENTTISTLMDFADNYNTNDEDEENPPTQHNANAHPSQEDNSKTQFGAPPPQPPTDQGTIRRPTPSSPQTMTDIDLKAPSTDPELPSLPKQTPTSYPIQNKPSNWTNQQNSSNWKNEEEPEDATVNIRKGTGNHPAPTFINQTPPPAKGHTLGYSPSGFGLEPKPSHSPAPEDETARSTPLPDFLKDAPYQRPQQKTLLDNPPQELPNPSYVPVHESPEPGPDEAPTRPRSNTFFDPFQPKAQTPKDTIPETENTPIDTQPELGPPPIPPQRTPKIVPLPPLDPPQTSPTIPPHHSGFHPPPIKDGDSMEFSSPFDSEEIATSARWQWLGILVGFVFIVGMILLLSSDFGKSKKPNPVKLKYLAYQNAITKGNSAFDRREFSKAYMYYREALMHLPLDPVAQSSLQRTQRQIGKEKLRRTLHKAEKYMKRGRYIYAYELIRKLNTDDPLIQQNKQQLIQVILPSLTRALFRRTWSAARAREWRRGERYCLYLRELNVPRKTLKWCRRIRRKRR